MIAVTQALYLRDMNHMMRAAPARDRGRRGERERMKADPSTTSPATPETARMSHPRQGLAAVGWLQGVPGATLDGLARQSVLHRVPPGSLLFEQAETPSFAQFLLAGSIELLGVRGKDETLIELLRPVDLVVPAAVLNRQPYLMRARVHEEAQLLLIQAEAFRSAIVADHALCLAVLSCQAAQFRRQVKHAKNVKLRSAEERVGAWLVALIDGAGTAEAVRLPMEKRLIASQLGMTRETFSRALAAMARHGLRISGDMLQVEDAGAARARFPLDPLIDGPEPIAPLPQNRS
ncbi:helix-turn-helix domain-containing protein [Limobrevibacterium gyesilva]|uniref:Helix-turn-helix domain-containing protein n=1 Tax=Limobrevibacterium gyesilva TaxID=2991712 RepID=A0AA41YVX6_9PROT|nr:helix-turn-helix domain-containing protein [Limobrevibacterium gyesilva]MCW3476367.1 helix-turn-helix domain-containing protein [Limobrevibacterium gyesilva]